MYRIIGSDGKEYGPVDAEQIRRWVAEGRMNSRSMVLAEGAVEWKPLDQFPELMGAVAGSQTFIPANSSGTAATQVNGPATGLIVTAVLGFMVQALGFLGNMFGFSQGFGTTGSESAMAFFTGTMGIILNLVGVAIGVVILLGALKMKRLESHGFAMAASILALVPCVSPCCVVGLPIGIWSLVVLMKPEVKAAFH